MTLRQQIVDDDFAAGLKEFAQYKAFMKAMEGRKNDPPFAPTGPYGHGETGLFNIPGTADSVFSAIGVPLQGVLGRIPSVPGSTESGGMFGSEEVKLTTIVTGVTEGNLNDPANQPTTECAYGPVPGLMKVCTQVNPEAYYRASIDELAIKRAGTRRNRIDPTALRLMNVPMFSDVFGAPSNIPGGQQVIQNEIARRLWIMSLSLRLMLSRQVWNASPASNNGEAKFLTGLQTWINAGNKRDYIGSHICTAADSVVMNFGFDAIGGSGRNVVEYLEAAEYFVYHKAGQQALSPFAGFIVMRPEAWQAVSAVTPVRRYFESLEQIANFTNGRVVIDATDALTIRNDMRQGMFIELNSRIYQVVEDDGIPELTSLDNANLQGAQVASDIYFVPMTVLGGAQTTFFDYHDYQNQQAQSIMQWGENTFVFTSDNGMFLWTVDFSRGCIKVNVEFAPRLQMMVTQLAFRIQNVMTEPLQHLSSPYPDSDYFSDGGKDVQAADDNFYVQWATTPQNI